MIFAWDAVPVYLEPGTGKIAVSVNDEPVDFSQRYYYKGCMYSDLPNLAVVFGYINASWTLRADINSDYVCRLLREMRSRGADVVNPVMTPRIKANIVDENIFGDYSSGYLERAKDINPKNATEYPWRLNQEYVLDRKRMASDPIDDGILVFSKAGANARQADEQLEAAE